MPTTENDATLSPYPAFLIIGDSGTRKTRFLIDAAEHGFKPYVFDFDNGMSILRGAKGITYDTFVDVPYGQLKTVNPEKGRYKFGEAWPAFLKKINEIGEKIDKGTNEFNLLGADSLTTMGNCAMAHVLAADPKSEKKIVAELQHYNPQMQMVEKALQQLSTWDVVKVVTAHIQRDTNDLTQIVEMLPLVTGKLSGKVSIYFDEVYYTKVDPAPDAEKAKFPFGKPTLITDTSGLMKQAKTRYGVKTGTETRFGAVWPQIDKAIRAGK